MQGDVKYRGMTLTGVRLHTYHEDAGTALYSGTIGIVAEIHAGEVIHGEKRPWAVLLNAGILVQDDSLVIRGFRRAGVHADDLDRFFKPDQMHQSVIVRFYPHGDYIDRLREILGSTGGTNDAR